MASIFEELKKQRLNEEAETPATETPEEKEESLEDILAKYGITKEDIEKAESEDLDEEDEEEEESHKDDEDEDLDEEDEDDEDFDDEDFDDEEDLDEEDEDEDEDFDDEDEEEILNESRYLRKALKNNRKKLARLRESKRMNKAKVGSKRIIRICESLNAPTHVIRAVKAGKLSAGKKFITRKLGK